MVTKPYTKVEEGKRNEMNKTIVISLQYVNNLQLRIFVEKDGAQSLWTFE